MTKSKSDEILTKQLTGAGVKQHVTHAEAVAEAGGHAAPAAAEKKAAKKKDPDAATTPRVKIAPGSTPSMVLAQHLGGDGAALYEQSRLVLGDKPNAHTAENTGGIINKLAKKVAEKAVNLLRHRASPDNVQVYTRIGMDLLLKKGELTSKGLTDKFLEKYTPGTARAQANQIMNLFPALKVADKVGSTLTLNDDSVIVAEYKAGHKKG